MFKRLVITTTFNKPSEHNYALQSILIHIHNYKIIKKLCFEYFFYKICSIYTQKIFIQGIEKYRCFLKKKKKETWQPGKLSCLKSFDFG